MAWQAINQCREQEKRIATCKQLHCGASEGSMASKDLTRADRGEAAEWGIQVGWGLAAGPEIHKPTRQQQHGWVMAVVAQTHADSADTEGTLLQTCMQTPAALHA